MQSSQREEDFGLLLWEHAIYQGKDALWGEWPVIVVARKSSCLLIWRHMGRKRMVRSKSGL